MTNLNLRIVGLLAVVLTMPATEAQALFSPIGELQGDALVNDINSTSVGANPHAAQGSLVGTFVSSGDTLSAGVDGNAVASVGNAVFIQAPGGPIDSLDAGAGFRWEYAVPASEIQFRVVGQTNFTLELEAFMGASSLGADQFSVTGGFPNPLMRFGTGGIHFDALEIRTVGATGGWGLDDVGKAGLQSTVAVPVMSEWGLAILLLLVIATAIYFITDRKLAVP